MLETYSLDREGFARLAGEHACSEAGGAPAYTAYTAYTVISRKLAADMETPVSALQKIRRGQFCFLLESVERADQVGRYSFLGTEPRQTLFVKDGQARLGNFTGGSPTEHTPCADPLAALQTLVSGRRLVSPEGAVLPRFATGAVGYAGYDIASSLEPVQLAASDPLNLPDLAFALYDTMLVFDHVQRTAQALTLAPLNANPAEEYRLAIGRIETLVKRLRGPAPAVEHVTHREAVKGVVRSNCTQAEFERRVKAAKEHIAAGDIIQVVLSQRFERDTCADPFTIYRALRMVNPSPYMFFLQLGDFYIVGASPEMLVQVQAGKISTHPIAGTRPRGRDRQEDEQLQRELCMDEKEGAEHLMLVDLGRNDVGRIARIGTVSVPRFMQVERYSHVMHLVSAVEGTLREELGPVDALRACFPAGTVSGAPKVRAMQIISEQERDRRGPYAGALGYIGYDGNMDTAITIRTLVIKNGLASVQAGAGIVADSVPAGEYAETQHKARALLSAIDLAEEIEEQESGLHNTEEIEAAPEEAPVW